jgi:hypothetical protein
MKPARRSNAWPRGEQCLSREIINRLAPVFFRRYTLFPCFALSGQF